MNREWTDRTPEITTDDHAPNHVFGGASAPRDPAPSAHPLRLFDMRRDPYATAASRQPQRITSREVPEGSKRSRVPARGQGFQGWGRVDGERFRRGAGRRSRRPAIARKGGRRAEPMANREDGNRIRDAGIQCCPLATWTRIGMPRCEVMVPSFRPTLPSAPPFSAFPKGSLQSISRCTAS